MKTSDFDYALPPALIAQTPVEPRDNSRLMVVNRAGDSIEHRHFHDIVDYLQAGDVLVFNESLVIPARLHGQKEASGGQVEILLLRRLEEGIWEALVRRGKRLRIGSRVAITEVSGGSPSPRIMAEVIGQGEGGIKVIRFSDETLLSSLGKVPLPPYINTPLSHPDRYQTVYARVAGSVAAPTAGLHFTPELLDRLEKKGVRLLFVCLHIGLDTFSPVREEDPAKHHIHREYGMVSEEVASELSAAKRQGRKIICVGTTTMRILEQVAQLYPPERLKPFADWVSLYVLPGYRFR
ncbi:MAG: tRNA preQ1(34) S-adenosylmethionine ribosyltransferase-isomerase QueA, partial [Dehalococcoidia bacterium]